MAKRRANGEGNIRKRKDGHWEGRYTAGRNPEASKPIYKNVLGKTQAEVKEMLKAAIEQSKSIDAVRANQYTVGEWLGVWLEDYAKINLRPFTHLTCRGFLKNHIGPAIGAIPLAKLTTLDLQRFYKTLLESGRVERREAQSKPKGLSAKTVRNIHQVISPACEKAMAERLILRNPAKGCALPKIERKEMKTLTADQLGAFFREAKADGVLCALLSGLIHRLAAGRATGAEMDGHRLWAGHAPHPAGHLPAKT